MSVKLFLFLYVILASTVSNAQEDSLEWAKWGIADSFNMEFQRLTCDTTVLQGKFLAFYRDHVIIDGQFDQGKKVGQWKHFSLYTDTLRAEGLFENGIQTGEWNHYHLNGQLKSTKRLINGLKKGEQTSFYKNGNQRFEAYYVNNKHIQAFTTFYATGDTALHRTFDFSQSIWKGNSRSYYNRGPKYETYAFEVDPNNPNLQQLLAGGFSLEEHVFLNLNGVKQKHPYPWMRLEGSYRKYHSTGYMWEHLVYLDGRLSNVLQGSNQWGSPQKQVFEENDTQQFKLVRFQNTGDTLSVENYKDGFLNGSSEYYESLNRITWSGSFSKAVPQGLWKQYDRNLFPYKTINFSNPDSIRIKTERKEGILLTEETLANNQLNGKQLIYGYYGELESEIEFSDGLLDGQYIAYRKERPFKTGAYTEGIKTGTWETFNPRGKVTWSEAFEGINCQKDLSPSTPLMIVSAASSAYKYQPVFLPADLHISFQTPFVQNVGGAPHSIRLATGGRTGDVLFMVTVEDTGHIIKIECIGASKEDFYQISLSILQQMPFMFPAYIEGMPETTECIVSFNFNRL
jgi:antitoxin component YwqK of YwqJK toxin-antitoxin module